MNSFHESSGTKLVTGAGKRESIKPAKIHPSDKSDDF